MFERPGSGSQAVLVSLDFGDPDFAESTEELVQLATSAKISVVDIIKGKRVRPDPALFAGRGKVEEIAALLARAGAQLVIFNHELSPAQARNLEKRLDCRVIDRVSLILDIFAQRAQSHEGKLQVELAQLGHLATRLVRGWTHLERQKGGIGLRGPGETQLETDRRLLGKRVKLLKDKLARVASQREVQRRARRRASVLSVSLVGYPNAGKSTLFNAFTRSRARREGRPPARPRASVLSVSLVGYTNAGKSTLFNALTRGRAYAADQLFATLDTTTRRVFLPGGAPLRSRPSIWCSPKSAPTGYRKYWSITRST